MKKYRVKQKSKRTWIVETENGDEYDVFLDFDGWHCNCLYCCYGSELRECSHIKQVKKTLRREMSE